jgi:histidyl-tRNA synthetase
LELTDRSLRGQLKHADRMGARYVAIIGDERTVSLRNMESGDQEEIEPAAVIPSILRGSRLA